MTKGADGNGEFASFALKGEQPRKYWGCGKPGHTRQECPNERSTGMSHNQRKKENDDELTGSSVTDWSGLWR